MISRTFKKAVKLFTKEEVSTTSFVTAAASHVGSFFVDAFKAFGHAGMAVLKAVTCAVSAFYGEKFDTEAGMAALTETKDAAVSVAKAVYHGVASVADIAIATTDLIVAAAEYDTGETGVALAAVDTGLDAIDTTAILAGKLYDTYAVDAA